MKLLLLPVLFACQPLLAEDQPPPAAPTAKQADILQVGSDAPKVAFEPFIKGAEIHELDPKKTYVLEFWAMGCAPCVRAIPHMTEMAKDLGDTATIIGVNVYDKPEPGQLKSFVDRQGDKMNYPVTRDKDSFMDEHWMKAAQRNGIPCAFVVVKGKIAWIGHPALLETAMVKGLADGTLNAEVLAKEEAQEMAAQREMVPRLRPYFQDGDFNGAVKDLDGVIAEAEKIAERYPKSKPLKHLIERLKKEQETKAAKKDDQLPKQEPADDKK